MGKRKIVFVTLLLFLTKRFAMTNGFSGAGGQNVISNQPGAPRVHSRNKRWVGKDGSNEGSQPKDLKADESSSRGFVASVGPPFLALVTEPDACDNCDRIEETLQAVQTAVSTNRVALVSVRVTRPQNIQEKEFQESVTALTKRLVKLAQDNSFFVVVSSDWTEAAVNAHAHGIHVKEHHRSLIPAIRQQFNRKLIIGTSAHSVSSAIEAYSAYHVDYLFVGTCYETASHPGKVDLEGPRLPGEVCRALDDKAGSMRRPVVMGIGGIDEHNCHEPVVLHGADGVATIRSVLQARDPAKTVRLIQRNMRQQA